LKERQLKWLEGRVKAEEKAPVKRLKVESWEGVRRRSWFSMG
jgi:hypothetical protein